MLKLTKTGIGLLSKQYRSVLKKCLLLNLGLFLLFPENASAGSLDACLTYGGTNTYRGYDWNGSTYTVDCYFSEKPSGIETSFMCTKFGCGYYANLGYGVVGPYSSLDTNYGHIVNAPSMYASYPYVKYSTLENFIRLDTEISATNTNLSNLTNELHNYYYTFRVDERDKVIDSASFFQKDFLTLQKVDLQSKNPTHLGAFTKCDEACPRPSERFSLSLSQEQMLKNDASVDAGTSRHCLRQFGDVVADLLKNTAAKGLRMYEFMNEEVRHA